MDALKWILEEAEENGSGLLINYQKRDAIFGLPSPSYPGLVKMNAAAQDLSCLHNSLTLAWAPLEVFPHKYFDQNGKKKWRLTPWPHSREIPDGALIHPSLRHRLALRTDYKPKNLDRNCIRDFSQSPLPLQHSQVVDQLTKENYGVYRPK
jgi:hypothetical protein